MREFDEATITDAVQERVANAPDPRARRVSQALVKHLHAFIREIEPTQAEWEWGIRFAGTPSPTIGTSCTITVTAKRTWKSAGSII
jgi:hypothetical protein